MSQKRLARPSLGGMLATRQGSLTVAVLCAAIAAAILLFALSQYRSNLQRPPAQATVLVATGQIAQGTTAGTIAAEKLYKSTPVVASQMAPGAISDAGALNGETAAVNILPGQQLTSADFSTNAGVIGMLAPNQRAISLSVDEAHGDTDVLQPGDHVDVYSTMTSNGSTAGAEMYLVVSNALVLKPAGGGGATPAKAAAAPAVTGNSLVLAVSAAQAPVIAYAADQGRLFISLRPPNAAATPSAPVTRDMVLSGAVAATPSTTTTGAHP